MQPTCPGTVYESKISQVWKQVYNLFSSIPNELFRAFCTVCKSENSPLGTSFAVSEGYTAITKHAGRDKHIQALKDRAAVPRPVQRQQGIEDGVENLRKLNENKENVKKKLLTAQTLLANTFHHHNVNSEIFSCFSKIVGDMFPDSEVAKLWSTNNSGMGSTKGDYYGLNGIAPFLKEGIISNLRASPFSLSFDESSINKTSQLDLNVSYVQETVVIKRFLETIEMKAGTTAEEIVEAVFRVLDTNKIPVKNLVTISTDGCSAMLGKFKGVHAVMRERLPWLPDWGGCMAHSPSNMLKAATACLSESFLKSVSSFHTYLQSQSLHR